LDLAPVDDDRGRQTAQSQELAAQILGVHLFVLPDPYEGLVNQGADLWDDAEIGDPPRHRFLAIGHGHDLLALQREQEEPLAFPDGVAGTFTGPSVQLGLDVPEERALE
jgi:hypothetical protein